VPWDDANVVSQVTEETVGFPEWTAQFSVWETTGKDSTEACAISCRNWAVYSVLTSGMTSHSKISQFNWECIWRSICVLSYCYKVSDNSWGYLFDNGKIFNVQKKIVRIMAGAQNRTSCTCSSLFKQLAILPVPCQHFRSLMHFITNFQTRLSIHNVNTRNKHHLHEPNAYLPCF
jgi:hypothetical protein